MSTHLRPHTSTYKGKRVRVVLIDGTIFIDKFKEATKKYSIFEAQGRILKRDIKAFSNYKEMPHLHGHKSP